MNSIKVMIDGVVSSFQSFGSSSIHIDDNEVWINGKKISHKDAKKIEVNVEGSCGNIECPMGKVEIHGDARSVSTQSGDIIVGGSVKGDTKSMSGDIQCGKVGGNVRTMSGDVKII